MNEILYVLRVFTCRLKSCMRINNVVQCLGILVEVHNLKDRVNVLISRRETLSLRI